MNLMLTPEATWGLPLHKAPGGQKQEYSPYYLAVSTKGWAQSELTNLQSNEA